MGEAGDLIIVDGAGSGDFVDIESAVTASSHGDVVLVRRGSYAGFISLKGVSIFPYGDGAVIITSRIGVGGIPADQQFVVSELSITPAKGESGYGFFAGLSDGPVRIQLCDVEAGVGLDRVSHVAITQCLIQGRACTPGSGIYMKSCLLGVFETDAFAGDTCCASSDGQRSHGIWVEANPTPPTELFASGSLFVGNQNFVWCHCVCGPNGGTGARISRYVASPPSFLDCTLIGGPASFGEHDVFIGCGICDGGPGAPLSGRGTSVTTDEHRRFSSQTVVVSGDTMTLRFAGRAGDVVRLRYSDSTGYTTIGALEGVDLLGAGVQELIIGTLPAGGVLNTTWTPPALPPGVAADTFFLQATFEKSDGTVLYRTPSAVAQVSPCNFPDSPTATYCSTQANSTGQPGVISQSGSTSVAANDLVLLGSSLPSGNNGVFVYSPDMTSTPLGNGTLCVGNQTLGFVLRLPPVTSDGSGVAMHAFDNTTPPDPAGQVFPGETWFFQLWFRDPDAGGAGFNFTDGLSVTFCP